MMISVTIDDGLLTTVEAVAALRRVTISKVLDTALREHLLTRKPQGELPPLPTFDGGRALVDIDDRDALSAAMGER